MGAVLPFAVLAVLSLAFVFGTPLYALLFYGLPGFSQLHSPFRWVFPYTLSVAFLAGAASDDFAEAVTAFVAPSPRRGACALRKSEAEKLWPPSPWGISNC